MPAVNYVHHAIRRLPFGITSAPEYFQKRMSEILDGISGVVNLMDDVVVFGSNQKEHDERLHRTLERLSKAGVTLNKEKCQFSVKGLSFLGCVVSKDGIRPDPAKVRANAEMKAPTNVAEMRRLLGLANHCSRFIANLAEKTAPLRKLPQKNAEWLWTDAQEAAFEYLKKLSVRIVAWQNMTQSTRRFFRRMLRHMGSGLFCYSCSPTMSEGL